MPPFGFPWSASIVRFAIRFGHAACSAPARAQVASPTITPSAYQRAADIESAWLRGPRTRAAIDRRRSLGAPDSRSIRSAPLLPTRPTSIGARASGLPVPDRWISALVPWNGLLVAAGGFQPDRRPTLSRDRRVERHSVVQRRELPFGSYVFDLAPYLGGLVALGSEHSNQVVWRWDGARWTTLEPLPLYSNGPRTMAVLGDQIAVSVVQLREEVPGHPLYSRVLLHTNGGWTTLGGRIRRWPLGADVVRRPALRRRKLPDRGRNDGEGVARCGTARRGATRA